MPHHRRIGLVPVVAIAIAIALSVASQRAAATLIIVPNASAPVVTAPVPIPNHTFQNPDVLDGQATFTTVDPNAVPNWTFASSNNGLISSGVWDPATGDYTIAGGNNTALPPSADGGQAAFIYLDQDTNVTPQPLVGDLTTAAPVALVESDFSYDLTVALGRAKGIATGEVEIQLLISKFPIASLIVSPAQIPQDDFADFTVNLTTFPDYPFAGAELHARITHRYAGLGDVSVDVDNVRLDMTQVPEPSSATLAVLALGATVTRRRHRRHKRSHE
jgi:hypothetical protein